MALAPWKIIAMGLIPVAGVVIAYPLVSNYKSKSKIEFKNLENFKTHCRVLDIEGDSKELLVCPVTNNSDETSFYFYDKGNNGKLPQKIKEIKVEADKKQLSLTLEKKKVSISDTKLNFPPNTNLIRECQVNWQDSKEQKSLNCSNKPISQQLKEFIAT